MTNTVSIAKYRKNRTNKRLERVISSLTRIIEASFRIAFHLAFCVFCFYMCYGAYEIKLYDMSSHLVVIAILALVTVRLPLKSLEECAQCLGYAFAAWLVVAGISNFVAEVFGVFDFHDKSTVQVVFGVFGLVLLLLPFSVVWAHYVLPEPPPGAKLLNFPGTKERA